MGKVAQNVKCANSEASAGRLGLASTWVGEQWGQASARRQRRGSPERWPCSCPVCIRRGIRGPRPGLGGGERRLVAALAGTGWGERLRRLLVLPLWLVAGWACPSCTPLFLVSATTISRTPTPPPPETTSPSRSLDTGWPASTPDPQNRTQGRQGPGPSQTDPALAPWGRGPAAAQRPWAKGLSGAPGPAGCSFPLRAGLHPV